MPEAKIEIRSKPAPIPVLKDMGEKAPQHLYVIFTNSKGEQTILRGGPEGSNVAGALSGDILVETAPYVDGHLDWEKEKGPIHLRTTIATGTDAQMQAHFDKMWAKGQEINAGKYDYKFPIPGSHCQNSNTVVKVMVEAAGLKFKLPTRTDGTPVVAPGHGSDFKHTQFDDFWKIYTALDCCDPYTMRHINLDEVLPHKAQQSNKETITISQNNNPLLNLDLENNIFLNAAKAYLDSVKFSEASAKSEPKASEESKPSSNNEEAKKEQAQESKSSGGYEPPRLPVHVPRPKPDDDDSGWGIFFTIVGGVIQFGIRVIIPLPVVIDINGDGVEFISLPQSNVFFDMNGDGIKDRTAWVSPKDAFLAIDIDGDNAISHAKEIVFTMHDPNAHSDLEAISSVFDSNHNGKLDPADERWIDFKLWQDINSDGTSQPNELTNLTQAGINYISLDISSNKNAEDRESVKIILICPP